MVETVDRNQLREQLTELPLEQDEATVYISLLETGTAKARAVAEEAEIHRTTAYRILKELADRGLVEVSVGRPMEFTAVPPRRLFEEIRSEKTRELERVDEVEEDVAGALEQIRSEDDETGSDEARWRMIKGRECIVSQAVDVLEEADQELRYLATDPLRTQERENVETDWESVLAKKAPEIDVRVLINPEPVQDEVLETFRSVKGLELRFTDSEARAQCALIDGEVFVWVVVGTEPSEDVALWSDAQDLYTSQRLLFDGLWAGAEPQT